MCCGYPPQHLGDVLYGIIAIGVYGFQCRPGIEIVALDLDGNIEEGLKSVVSLSVQVMGHTPQNLDFLIYKGLPVFIGFDLPDIHLFHFFISPFHCIWFLWFPTTSLFREVSARNHLGHHQVGLINKTSVNCQDEPSVPIFGIMVAILVYPILPCFTFKMPNMPGQLAHNPPVFRRCEFSNTHFYTPLF